MFQSVTPRSTRRLYPAALALSALALLSSVTVIAKATQQTAALPAEVTTWLSRNQAQRWRVMLETGEKLFNEGSCFRCHGRNGTGGSNGPDLTDKTWVQGDGSLENTAEVIMWGVRRRDLVDKTRRFQMNPMGGMRFDTDQWEAVTAYVWSLSHGTSRPER